MQLGKFQMKSFTSWKGLTRDNHIGAIFGRAPQKATNMMILMLAQYRGKCLDTFLQRFPVKYFETEDEYTWDVIGSSRKNVPIIGARTLDGTIVATGDTVGANGALFEVIFPEDWFAEGEVVVGELNEVYPLYIKGKGYSEGSNTVYTVQLMGGILDGMPGEQLQSGKRFSWEYAPIEDTMSLEVGDVRYASSTAMRNEFSHIRIQTKVPGNILDKKLQIGIPFVDTAGTKQVSNTWMHHVDYKLEETFSEYKCNILMFGRSNRNKNGEYLNFGKSGNVIKMGDGIRAQMSMGNTKYYNKFSIKLIEDALFELCESKLDYKDRTFILETGSRGAALFSKAVLDVVSGWSAVNFLGGNAANPAVISKTSSELHDNALSAGFQFTEFKAPMGVTLKVEVNPMYDDPVRNKILHPSGGVAESYRFDIMSIGSTEEPNIQLAKVRGKEEIRGYMWGLAA